MKRLLGQKFIALAPHQLVTLLTIKLTVRKNIFNVIEIIDNQDTTYPDAFFAYELIKTSISDNEEFYMCQIVTAHCPDQKLMHKLFRKIPRCSLVKQNTIKLIDLYEYLSKTSFRAYNKLLFRRLKLNESKMILEAKNIFSRMYYYQNVLCLSNLGQEIKFLAQIRNDPSRLLRNYRFRNYPDYNEQKRIQICLIGSFRQDVQIYMPPLEVQHLIELFDSQEGDKMKDCQQKMDIQMDSCSSEQDYLLKLSQDLKMKQKVEMRRDIKIDLCEHDQFYTDRYRSREKSP